MKPTAALDTNIRILIVDDFPTMRRIVRNVLTGLGFEQVDEASDGVEALNLLKAQPYQLLITDWNMPVMQGIELVEAIRADASFGALPILMMTAETTRELIMRAIDAGVNDYLVKPFRSDALIAKINKINSKAVACRPPVDKTGQ